MNIPKRLLENSWIYRSWQAPFAEQKLAVVRTDIGSARRVLDVGCGPGTNTAHFAHAAYLGIDLNEQYVEYARSRFGREFIAADVTTYTVPAEERFDFILVNSLLHHLPTPAVCRLLQHLAGQLTADGHIHVLDLVLPDERSVARTLAHWDRGDYPRPLAQWRNIFREAFEPVEFRPYSLGVFGLTLWNMIYFKGRAR